MTSALAGLERDDVGIDIILVNYFMSADLKLALDRLRNWRRGTVWIVDNSCDATEGAALKKLARDCPTVRILTAAENLGFGRGCNWAWALSVAPHVLLLNPDAQIEPTDIKRLSARLSRQSDLGAVSPLTYWNPEQSFLLPAPSNQSPWTHALSALSTRMPGLTRQLAARMVCRTRSSGRHGAGLVDVKMLAGALLMLKRRAVEACGGLFDPTYFMFFEDADLCLRLRKGGFGLAIDGSCRAVHTYRHKAYKAGLMAQSQSIFFRQHYPWYAETGVIRRYVDACRVTQRADAWFDVLAGKIDNAQTFGEATGQRGVVAFSPSMLMFPAIVRPHAHATSAWTDEEWSLLEPGSYLALLEGRKRWLLFEK